MIDGDATEAYSTPAFPPFDASTTVTSQSSYSVRSSSPVPSVLSMTSSTRTHAFTLEYGRGINNYSDVYRLPADDEEMDRLQKQHLMFREVLGKYPPVLADVLADDIPGETKTCLDLGCGSGGWIMEVALDFPNCSTVAVDLVPLQSITMPPNCRSEVNDINLGLEHYYGDFNVVHARLLSAGVNYTAFYICRVLRPGGLIYLAEGDFHIWDGNKQRWNIDTNVAGPPWWPYWMEVLGMAIRACGGSTEIASNIVQWVSDNDAFENLVHQEYWIPMSPWVQGDDPEAIGQRRIGELGRDDILAGLKSGRPLLLGSGMSPALIDEIEANVTKEVKEAKIPVYLRVVEVYARKKHPL